MNTIRILASAGSIGLGLIALPCLPSAQRTRAVEPEASWRLIRPSNTGIPGDYSQALCIDSADRPWIGAYVTFWEEGGMARWNEDDTWSTISSADHAEILSPRFDDIVQDATGVLWAGSEAGLMRYDPAVGNRSLRRFDAGNSALPHDTVEDLALAPDGTLWLAITEQFTTRGALVRLNPTTEEMTVFTTENGFPWAQQYPGWNFVEFVDVAPEAGGGYTVWFGDKSLGLATWSDGQFDWLGDPPVPFGSPTTPYELMGSKATDSSGNVWMNTNDGIARRNPDGSYLVVGRPAGVQGSQVQTVDALENGRALLGTYGANVYLYEEPVGWSSLGNWGGGFTYAMREDSTGAIWAAGTGGLGRWKDGQWVDHLRLTNTGMLGFFTSSIDFDAEGRVYMNDNASAGVGGFSILDGKRWTCVNDYNYGRGPAWGLPGDDGAPLALRRNGNVVLSAGLGQGLLEWDGSSYTYLVPQGYEIEEVVEDGLERVWAARDNFGTFLIANGEATQFTWSNSPLLPGRVVRIVEDRDAPGFVWIFSTEGATHTDGVTWTNYPRSLLDLTGSSAEDSVNAGDVAADGTLWMGTGRGLYHLDPGTLTYEKWDQANSPLPSEFFSHVEVAPDGSIWMSSRDYTAPYPGGVSHFDGQRWRVYSQGSSPLPHNQIWELTSRRVPGGYEVWIGTASEAIAVVKVSRALRSATRNRTVPE